MMFPYNEFSVAIKQWGSPLCADNIQHSLRHIVKWEKQSTEHFIKYMPFVERMENGIYI